MIDILVYLFENYIEADDYPDETTLARELSEAGFDRKEIDDAIAWINGLEKLPDFYPENLANGRSLRCYAAAEIQKIGTDGISFLMSLESAGILTPVQREWVLDRIMALREREVSLEQIKWIILLVLRSQGPTGDFFYVEDLLFGGEKAELH
jgi:Smg protein